MFGDKTLSFSFMLFSKWACPFQSSWKQTCALAGPHTKCLIGNLVTGRVRVIYDVKKLCHTRQKTHSLFSLLKRFSNDNNSLS